MGLTVRIAEVSDAAGLYLLNREWNGEAAADEDRIKKLLNEKSEIVMIALSDDKSAGFVCGKIVSSICHKTPPGEVSELFVSEKYRRRGTGRGLIEAMEKYFKENGISVVTINTSASNLSAQQFYKSCGYFDKQRLEFRKGI
jgi:ribosomal protein S18 acetylase RimI-like enzyme